MLPAFRLGRQPSTNATFVTLKRNDQGDLARVRVRAYHADAARCAGLCDCAVMVAARSLRIGWRPLSCAVSEAPPEKMKDDVNESRLATTGSVRAMSENGANAAKTPGGARGFGGRSKRA